MLNKENSLMWFKSEERYINDGTIASLLQGMLNEAIGAPLFFVSLNSKTKTAIYNQAKYECTLKLRIEPFSLIGANCETVNVRLLITYPTEMAEEKMNVMNAINKLIGPMSGGFNVTENNETVEYTFFSNFKKNETSTPENIQSEYTDTVTIEGNMHITRAGGGVIADMVKTYIVLGEKEYEIIFRATEDDYSANTNSPVKAGSFIPDTEFLSASYVKSCAILYRNDYICNLLRDLVKGRINSVDNPFVDQSTGKLIMRIKEHYPDVDIVQDYYIHQMKESKERGVYVSLQFVLMLVP